MPGAVAEPGLQHRLLGAADLPGLRAARVEPAAGRRIDRRGQVAGEDDPLPLVGRVRVGDRNGRQQRAV